MILNKKNNFLLIKNFEVNADYIESVLSNTLPEDTIVTPMANSSYYYSPRNYSDYKLSEYMSFYEINKNYGLEKIKAYIIVRNPYHSVLSNFFYSLKTLSVLENCNKLSKKNQDQFVDGYFKSDYFLKSTKELYIHNNMIMVEDVIIYEDGIEEQINNILLKHELPTIKLNTIEDNHVPKKINFMNVFSSKHINQITNDWKWEFDNFGYERFIE